MVCQIRPKKPKKWTTYSYNKACNQQDHSVCCYPENAQYSQGQKELEEEVEKKIIEATVLNDKNPDCDSSTLEVLVAAATEQFYANNLEQFLEDDRNPDYDEEENDFEFDANDSA